MEIKKNKETIQSENFNLLEYINANCSYVDSHEQKEIEALNIDFENFNGEELTLDDLLED